MSQETSALPTGWALTSIDVVVEPMIDQGGPDPGNFTYIDISSIDRNSKRITEPDHLSSRSAPTRARQKLRTGDVVVSMTRPNLNAVAMVPEALNGSIGSTGFCVLRSLGVEPAWIFYGVQRLEFIEAMTSLVQGALYPAVRPKDIRRFPLPVPPLAEQRRIIAAIEEHLSQLDAAVASLERVRAELPHYRTAVLKAAYDGRLSRSEMDDEESLGALALRPLGEFLKRIEAGRSFKCEERPPKLHEVGVAKVSAVTWGEFDEEESKTVTDHSRIEESYLIKPGDLLFSRANTIQLVGACVIVRSLSRRLMLSDKTLRLVPKDMRPDWILLCLRSIQGRQEIERLATGNQESMRNIGQERIRQIRISVPPAKQMDSILAEVSRRMSVIDALERTIVTTRGHAKAMRQSILQRAFSGKLVPQDPNDEHADVLIADISSQRTATPANGRRIGRTARPVRPATTSSPATATEPPPPVPRTPRSPAARRARGRNR